MLVCTGGGRGITFLSSLGENIIMLSRGDAVAYALHVALLKVVDGEDGQSD